MEKPIKTEYRNGRKIEIWNDSEAQSPCTNWDMGCCYLFEYNGYDHTLHEDCHWRDIYDPKYDSNNHSLKDAVTALVCKHVSDKNIYRFIKEGYADELRLDYNRSDRLWYLERVYSGKIVNGWHQIASCTPSEYKDSYLVSNIIEELEYDDLVRMLDIYGHDIVIKESSTTGYCQGDVVHIFCYCTKERFDKYIGSNGTPWKEHALSLMDGEVEEIGRWMWGDVYGYKTYVPVDRHISYPNDPDREDEDDTIWEEDDSCWGYFMDPDDIIDEILGKEVA